MRNLFLARGPNLNTSTRVALIHSKHYLSTHPMVEIRSFQITTILVKGYGELPPGLTYNSPRAATFLGYAAEIFPQCLKPLNARALTRYPYFWHDASCGRKREIQEKWATSMDYCSGFGCRSFRPWNCNWAFRHTKATLERRPRPAHFSQSHEACRHERCISKTQPGDDESS